MRESCQWEHEAMFGSTSVIHHLGDLPGLCRGQDQQLHVTVPIDAIWKGKELLCPCAGAPALPQGPAGTGQEQHSRVLGSPATVKWQPAPRNLSA